MRAVQPNNMIAHSEGNIRREQDLDGVGVVLWACLPLQLIEWAIIAIAARWIALACMSTFTRGHASIRPTHHQPDRIN